MEQSVIIIKDTTANPAPLGLMAFGLTTVLLNLHNAGIFEMNSMILAMGIFYGGIAQIIAGIIEAKKNNTFGFVAFVSYGSFWLTFAALLVIPKFGWVGTASPAAMTAYLIMWGIFTTLLFIGTLRISRSLQFIFFTLAVLFFLLAASESSTSASLKSFTAYEGIVCGASAIYTGAGALLNEIFGKTLLTLGIVAKK